MSSGLEKILIAWQNDIKFREEFKKNPEQALKNAEIEVSPEDLVKIKAMLKLDKNNDEKLDERTSK